MAVSDRIKSLQDKHAVIDQAIAREASHSMPDDLKIAEWKREKLRIKDAIEELSRHPVPL